MLPILAGLETEYGLDIEGRGADNQVEESKALVRAYPGKRFSGWDYRFESPRSDLRGFRLDRLAIDPRDSRFDEGRAYGSDAELRSDQVLENGARFYNDHGHPEYSTPECWSLDELMLHDLAGERVAVEAANAYAKSVGGEVRLYKNNTDFHGASYGTHESYLVPRSLDFEALYRAVTPMLIARLVLCGAGKVGSESGPACDFQLSQRADFLVDSASAETLYRRPVFNTRDEPHADPAKWTRLHVIAGDANLIPSATRRKVGLVKLALALAREGEAPDWAIPHPASAFANVSREPDRDASIELNRRSWTTATEILESYFAAAEQALGVRPGGGQDGTVGELAALIQECRGLLDDRTECPDRFRTRVDWAAKHWLLNQVKEENGWTWAEPALQSYDLEYHRIPRSEGLYGALADSGEIEPMPPVELIEARRRRIFESSRARARSIAISQFGDVLREVGWYRLSFEVEGRREEVDLPPDAEYSESLGEAGGVEEFIQRLRNRT